MSLRDEGQQRFTPDHFSSRVGGGVTEEHSKLLSHHKTLQLLLSCNPVMDTSSAPRLVKMFSYNNLIQKHIYEAAVINFN